MSNQLEFPETGADPLARASLTELSYPSIADLRRSPEKLAILFESAHLLLSSRQPEQIVQTICERVMVFLDCQVFFNYLILEGAGRMRLNAWYGVADATAREIEFLDFGGAVCGCAACDSERNIAEGIPNTLDERTGLVKSFGIKAYACHPLMFQGRTIGTLSFGTASRSAFRDDEIELMQAVSNLAASAMARKQAEEELKRKDEQIRQAYTEVIAAVTGGKLVLMTGQEIRLALGQPVTGELVISSANELAGARSIISQAVSSGGWAGEEGLPRLITCFSEGITNALKHSGSGMCRLCRTETALQFCVRDSGPGINFNNLPSATLTPGFSTVGTLGMGFTIMLNQSDRVLLATGPGETYLVMEMNLQGSPPAQRRVNLRGVRRPELFHPAGI